MIRFWINGKWINLTSQLFKIYCFSHASNDYFNDQYNIIESELIIPFGASVWTPCNIMMIINKLKAINLFVDTIVCLKWKI